MNTEITITPKQIADNSSELTVSSLEVAEKFGKNHFHILRDIENLLEKDVSKIGCIYFSKEFIPIFYLDSYQRSKPAYQMTLKGFRILANSFTGEKALVSLFALQEWLLVVLIKGRSFVHLGFLNKLVLLEVIFRSMWMLILK